MKVPFWTSENKRNTSDFANAFSANLSEAMYLPEEFVKFFNWAEKHDCIGSSVNGEPFIVVDSKVLGPDYISSIKIHPPKKDEWWLGSDKPDFNSRLKVFARTGGDGSSAAFWIDNDGKQQIVHLGSGSGSVMIGKWVNSPLDFLRLIAIGYDELCWPEYYKKRPKDLIEPNDEFHPPLQLAQWLKNEYGATVPQKASEIVGNMSEIGEPSDDPFCSWIGSTNPP